VLEYELEFVPRGFAVRDHLHPLQEERHEVLEGTLGIVVAGWQRASGRAMSRRAGGDAAPNLRNPGSADPRAFALRPALESEVLLETLFGLARDGKVDAKGNPPPLQLAVIFSGLQFAASSRACALFAVAAPAAAVQRGRGEADGEYVFVARRRRPPARALPRDAIRHVASVTARRAKPSPASTSSSMNGTSTLVPRPSSTRSPMNDRPRSARTSRATFADEVSGR
jgi:hypothetical protein